MQDDIAKDYAECRRYAELEAEIKELRQAIEKAYALNNEMWLILRNVLRGLNDGRPSNAVRIKSHL